MNLQKIGKVFTSKFVGTGPSSYEKKLPSRGLTKVEKNWSRCIGPGRARTQTLLNSILADSKQAPLTSSTEDIMVLGMGTIWNFSKGTGHL
jgi:hypothetical protein